MIFPGSAGGLDIEQCSFGYKINPDGDNPCEVLIYPGQVDLNKDDVVKTTYISIASSVVISGTEGVWVRVRVLPTGIGDPWPALNIFIEKSPTVSGLTYWASYKLYEFTAEANTATPPVIEINEVKTKIYRFLDIQRDGGGDDLPNGTEAEPHLVWDHDAAEWVKGVIVPPGTESTPHLKWNHDTLIWEAALIIPDGTEASPHLVWDHENAEWTIDEIIPTGGDAYTWLVWEPMQDEWITVNLFAGLTEGVPITIVTDVQFANNLFQKKTRTITNEDGGITISAESAWTTITGGTAEACP
jgi:hypothetical protein